MTSGLNSFDIFLEISRISLKANQLLMHNMSTAGISIKEGAKIYDFQFRGK